jgi:hypothetical protein
MASIRKKVVEPGVPRCPGDKHTMVWVRPHGGGPDQLTCCPRCRDGPREAGGIMRLMTVTKHEDGTKPAATQCSTSTSRSLRDTPRLGRGVNNRKSPGEFTKSV